MAAIKKSQMKSLKETQLSKKLTWLLRHGAKKESLPIGRDGYVPVKSILQHPKYGNCFELPTLERIVSSDKKQRFALRQNPENGEYEIRANQGHSIEYVNADECMERIQNSGEIPIIVHGTYYHHWPFIKMEGLKCMNRNHIHFTPNDKLEGVISGFRKNCEILIYVDAQKAMDLGAIEFYRSSNNVILSSGIENCIPSEYFAKVIDRRTGKELSF